MLNKTTQKKLLQLVKAVLVHRRNGKVKYEISAREKLDAYCQTINVDPADAMEQGIAWLKRNSIAAMMNGWV